MNLKINGKNSRQRLCGRLWRAAESGSVLIVTLGISVVLVITLAGYLYWVRTQNLLVAQSQAWNRALVDAEAGIEDAMAQINVAVGTSDPTNYTTSAIYKNAWPVSGSVYGPRPNTTLGGVSNSYSVIIVGTNVLTSTNGPTLISTGYTLVPMIGQPIARTVKVTTALAPMFGSAITAVSNITMNGNNITVDGYDSSDNVHFPNGQYTNYPMILATGNVASEYGLISVGNANIYGKILTTPVAPVPSVGANGYVGEWPTVTVPASHIEDGWYLNDFNMDIPDVQVPAWYTAANYTPFPSFPNGGGTNTIGGANVNYYLSGSISMGNKDVLHVMGGGVTQLYLTGSFSMSPSSGGNSGNAATILIDPNASLIMYVGTPSGTGTSVSFSSVNYGMGNPSSLMVYGLPSTTSVTFAGNAYYFGTIYAPEASFGLNGGGGTTTDIQGALVVHDINMNGHFNVHYDNNLARGHYRGYVANSWREL
jgi:hypothetical protein